MALKYEKLTFTPSRVIEIERTPEDTPELWSNVVLKPGREVTFGPFRDWLDDDDWYIECGRIYRVLHCDVERVYAQLAMEAEEAALNSAPCDTRYPPEPHEMTPLGDYCVKCRRTAEYVLATGRRAARRAAPCTELATLNDTHAAKAEEVGKAWEDLVVKGAAAIMRENARIKAQASRALAAEQSFTVGGIKVVADPMCPPGEIRIYADNTRRLHPEAFALAKAAAEKRSADDDMVSTIIAEQVTRGGVDTPGSRAEAERWCAYLAECVCEGMRATTDDSALKLANTDSMRPGGWRMQGGKLVYAGKPLGRP